MLVRNTYMNAFQCDWSLFAIESINSLRRAALTDSINLCQCGTQTLALSSPMEPFSKLSTVLTLQLQTALTLVSFVSDSICTLKKMGGRGGRKQVRCYYFEIFLEPSRNSRDEKKRGYVKMVRLRKIEERD